LKENFTILYLQMSQIVLHYHEIKDMMATPRILFKISVNPWELQNETTADQRPPLILRDILFHFAIGWT